MKIYRNFTGVNIILLFSTIERQSYKINFIKCKNLVGWTIQPTMIKIKLEFLQINVLPKCSNLPSRINNSNVLWSLTSDLYIVNIHVDKA